MSDLKLVSDIERDAMTDQKNDTEELEYVERPEKELSELRKAAQQGSFGGYQYVAQPAPGHDIHGIWSCFSTRHRSGYATHGYGISWLIREILKYPVMAIPHRVLDIQYDLFPEDRKDEYEKLAKEPVGICDLLISSFPPTESSFMRGLSDKLIAYVAHEGNSASRSVVELCNSSPGFDQIWVVSDFVKRSFMNGGMKEEKLRVVPPLLCGGPWPTPPVSDVSSRPITHDDPFVFGFIGTWHERKGMHDLVRAYFSAFKRNEPVRLEIRTSQLNEHSTIALSEEKIKGEIVKIAQTEFGEPNYPLATQLPKVSVNIGTELSDAKLIEWCGSLDAFANSSFGEGCGMPQHWAKAQGVPLVSTEYGAVGDLVKATSGNFVVPHQLEQISLDMLKYNRLFDPMQKWGKYKFVDFGVAMRKAFEAGRIRDVASAEYVKTKHGVENVSKILKGLLDELGIKYS